MNHFTDRDKDIERGLRLMSGLGEVMPEEAGENTNAVYEDIQTRLRVPFVNFLFRTLANYPDYLSFAWGRLSPQLLSADFERAAGDLRSRALIEPAPERLKFDPVAGDDLEKVRAFTDTIHYVLPKLLLVATAFDEGLGGASCAGTAAPNAVEPGVAKGTLALPMVSSEEAGEELSALFGRIRERHGHPDVASYYRGLGNWPALLQDLWGRLESLVGSDAYAGRKQELLGRSRDAVCAMPLPERSEVLGLGLGEGDVEDLRGILAVFRFRVVPDTFLEVQVIKALLDGREAALSSRFSFV
ncbi:MAG: halocarboxylic acid dehydrogenase DehI family protein [Rubrobacteraceae bacterium]